MNLPTRDLMHIMEHTRDLWEDLRGVRLFITGGTGFFGHWLVESFLYANQQLDLKASASILSREPESAQKAFPQIFSDPAITMLKGDIRNFEFPSGEFSHIIHAATDANAKLNDENPLLMLDTIIEGTRHTLDFAIQCKAEKFLLTSSVSKNITVRLIHPIQSPPMGSEKELPNIYVYYMQSNTIYTSQLPDVSPLLDPICL